MPGGVYNIRIIETFGKLISYEVEQYAGSFAVEQLNCVC